MTRIATLLLASASVAACAPLSQAGLVYASRGQAGVTLAAGTPETPGLELSIGMKTADFAYIPVVVGHPCEFSHATNCDQTLIPVFGTHRLTSETPDEAPGATPPPPPSPAQPKALARSGNGQDSAPAAVEQPAAVDQATNQILNALDKYLHTDNYQDAYSVYGTFNSSGNGSGPATGGSGTAGLSLGRVFSTGVAAQNLSEGQRQAQRTTSLTQCMTQAVASTSDTTLQKQLLGACATTAGQPNPH